MFMKRSGFTLVELVVVVGIIGLLSALAVVSLSRQQARSRDTRRVGDITNLRTALESYIDEKQQPPVTWAYPNLSGGTYDANDSGQWDVSSLPASTPTFMQFLADFGYLIKTPVDPINTAPNEGGPNGYIYHYYVANTGTFGFKNGWKAYVIAAYLETAGLKKPVPTLNNGPLAGNGPQYMYIVHEPVVQ